MDKERSSQLFISLVYTWQMQAMIQLGKIANPVDGSSQRDLDAAQVTIDILDMLKEKTLNNLNDDEKGFSIRQYPTSNSTMWTKEINRNLRKAGTKLQTN